MADRPDLNLSGDAISSTFKHLLQVREDDKTLYDALGNVLDDFRLSGSFTTSEFLEIEDLLLATAIYAEGIYKLCCE